MVHFQNTRQMTDEKSLSTNLEEINILQLINKNMAKKYGTYYHRKN